MSISSVIFIKTILSLITMLSIYLFFPLHWFSPNLNKKRVMLIALRINFKSHIQHNTSKNVKLYFKKNYWTHPILFSPSSRSQEDCFWATKCCWLFFRNNEDISSNCLLQKLILSKLKFEGVHYFKNILHLQVVIIIITIVFSWFWFSTGCL